MSKPTLRRRSLAGLVLLSAMVFIPLSCADRGPSQEVKNLRAFAKMYGYVRFFHPSDEAAALDWDRFAIYGVERVRGAQTSEELGLVLAELFKPVAPTVRVHASGTDPGPLEPLTPSPEMKVVAWQHLGVFLPGRPNIYDSKRTARYEGRSAGSPPFGNVAQSLRAVDHRGRRFRFSAWVRAEVEGADNYAQLWARVDGPGGEVTFFENMQQRPIVSEEWQRYEIVGAIAEQAEMVLFGGILSGSGKAWLDDVVVEIEDADGGWSAVEIGNPGFESGTAGERPTIWAANGRGYEFLTIDDESHSGRQCVVIERIGADGPMNLFESYPSIGEAIERPLDAGLSARVPLALFSDATSTLPRADDAALDELSKALGSIDLESATAEEVSVRLGSVVIAWNVFQHFYPYFDVVDVDWDSQLTASLEEALGEVDTAGFHEALRRMVAALQDGHGSVYLEEIQPEGGLPFAVSMVEDRLVVVSDDHPDLRSGDILVSLDGVDAITVFNREMNLRSGSPQWRRAVAATQLGFGDEGEELSLGILRGDEQLDLVVKRQGPEQRRREPRPNEIEEFEDGVYYVDLTRADMDTIDQRLEEIAAAPAVVFDLRGYPRGNHRILSHLLNAPDTSKGWMRVPQIVYPDHVEPAGWDLHGWEMQPEEPHISGRVVFVTDARAISYAESVMGLVEGYGLGEIVGSPTAGTNGNVNPLELPGGYRITWTGMKVVKLDGSQHHLIGVLPTVPAERTVQGIREGRDEVLEVAIEVARGQPPVTS